METMAPHQQSGSQRFLNLDEEVKLLQLVNEQPELPTIKEVLESAAEIRRAGLCRAIIGSNRMSDDRRQDLGRGLGEERGMSRCTTRPMGG
jgi:hypothetical protein